ncbi:hypothetical protein [Gordonia aichiensis]|uniref:hypothetical protein n=1 Tax=Gordonia aichiensis TaxID=36820 RepID=UPI003263A435
MTTARSGPAVQRFAATHAFALHCIAVYLLIRLVGVAILALMANLHDTGLAALATKWDGEWMLGIARYGYGGIPPWFTDGNGVHTEFTAYAFFPGYPMTVRAVSMVPGLSPLAAAMIVNVVAGIAAAVAIGRLGRFCAQRVRPAVAPTGAGERTVGLVLVALFAATPMSVVLNTAYTEALFCALAAWALVGVLEHRWLLAGAGALCAGLVRPTGIAVIAVVMLAAALAREDGPRRWSAVAMAPLGYLAYLAFVGRQTGSFTGWFRIQSDGWNTSFDGGLATWRFVTHTLGFEPAFAPTVTALVIVSSIVLLIWSVVDRVPWPVVLYAAIVMASVLLSDGLMMSRARLLLPAFVLLLPVAVRIARRPRREVVAFGAVVALLSGWFGAHMLTVFPYAV